MCLSAPDLNSDSKLITFELCDKDSRRQRFTMTMDDKIRSDYNYLCLVKVGDIFMQGYCSQGFKVMIWPMTNKIIGKDDTLNHHCISRVKDVAVFQPCHGPGAENQMIIPINYGKRRGMHIQFLHNNNDLCMASKGLGSDVLMEKCEPGNPLQRFYFNENDNIVNEEHDMVLGVDVNERGRTSGNVKLFKKTFESDRRSMISMVEEQLEQFGNNDYYYRPIGLYRSNWRHRPYFVQNAELRWYFWSKTNKIVLYGSEKCMDADPDSMKGKVHLWDCSRDYNQQYLKFVDMVPDDVLFADFKSQSGISDHDEKYSFSSMNIAIDGSGNCILMEDSVTLKVGPCTESTKVFSLSENQLRIEGKSVIASGVEKDWRSEFLAYGEVSLADGTSKGGWIYSTNSKKFHHKKRPDLCLHATSDSIQVIPCQFSKLSTFSLKYVPKCKGQQMEENFFTDQNVRLKESGNCISISDNGLRIESCQDKVSQKLSLKNESKQLQSGLGCFYDDGAGLRVRG